MYELSLVELESELSAELPTRTLMSRRHGRRGSASAHAHANFGSVANSNATNQSINNSQLATLLGVNTGGNRQLNAALVAQVGANRNDNTNTQFGTPVNYSSGF